MNNIMRIFVLIGIACVTLVSCSSKKSVEVGIEERNLVDVSSSRLESRTLLQDVNFEFDSSHLDLRAREVLNQNAQWLDERGDDFGVILEGHCDERGTSEYNLALGERRAHAVKRYLINRGITSRRLATVSYGEELPLDPRGTEEAMRRNRRVHFSIDD